MGLKRYSIAPRWFDAETFVAESAAKAKAKAYVACCEALGRKVSFRDFLDGLYVLCLGSAEGRRGTR